MSAEKGKERIRVVKLGEKEFVISKTANPPAPPPAPPPPPPPKQE